MIKVCTECGKSFECLYPDIWVYKRFQHYYCTWKCYRKDHNEMARMKKDGTPAKKPGPKKNVTAVDTVPTVKLSGPIVIETPEKNKVEVVETPEKTLADAMAGMKDAADTFFGACEDMGLNLEDKKITQPVSYDGMVIREVKGLFGRYRRSDIGGKIYIDFEPVESLDVLSYTVEQWKRFREEQEKAAAVLGVEL